MAQRALLVGELKRALKERGLGYAEVARRLGLSHASIKRVLSTGRLSLERVDAICELAGLEMSALLERAQERGLAARQLTLAQEREIVADPKLFCITWLLLNRTRFEDIVRSYRFTEREALRLLIKLDRLKVIELQPGNRVRLLISRHFSWRTGGPVQRYIRQRLLREFLESHFDAPESEFFFRGGTVSDAARMQIRRALQAAARECAEIMERDRGASGHRDGCAYVLAMRPWHYSGFAAMMR